MESMQKEDVSSSEKLGNKEFYNLITNKEVSWKSIIYDLINTEQLNPWDINLALLANKYLEKTRELEEANFFISSKVLLATSILLRLKSEILLHKYIKSIDEILFGKKDETKAIEKIEIDESELPLLYPKTPLPRYRKITLKELMSALDKAISTESRRIEKETSRIQQEKEAEIVMPKRKINIKDRIRKIYSRLLTSFKKKQSKISYSELTGNNKEEKLACFLPCLHLDNQHKLFLEQTKHFDEIYLWLYKHYQKEIALGNVKEAVELEKEFLEEGLSKETGYGNPLANFSDLTSEIIDGRFS